MTTSAPPRLVSRRAVSKLILLVVVAAIVAAAGAAWAMPDTPGRPFGVGADYRTLLDPDTPAGKWLNPRNIVWIVAQLHLLFAAFVLAVPMFAVIIEVAGVASKDPVQSKRFDDLAHEFTRLLTTAFSATAILGALLTFLCLGLYPKLFNHLVDVFGPTMYLYATIFFGESFSLYLYYYGWGKFKRLLHVGLGLLLNVFGVTLMLIANAWTTYMMAPGGVDPSGVVIDRKAAFFNFLLHPINIHRLIANFCMGGSVAAAYAAFKFLSTRDPSKRAHYDWMGYIGNFIAVLALLPLPFAGYYLGFEIYGYNQQLGIYMMGGVLSWLFIMQAVLIGVLFFAANYYLWLGMDRIEGAERYRGWIKFLLAVITVGVLVWATPKSLILTSSEIGAIGGTNHPVLTIFGVMSAKNTAVNLIILATFLSFILYRRGNKKIDTVPLRRLGSATPAQRRATIGTLVQVAAFGVAAAWVVFVGVGGYVPSLWLESSKRIAMSPWQVVAVLACMAIVLPIDIFLLRKAATVGEIRWGQVSTRSQYTLILLAVSFTWLMGLMGFVRSSLRQHWHVYEIMKDDSPWAYTPAIGYATILITTTVTIFFGMVAVIFWIANLGVHEAEAHAPEHAAVHGVTTSAARPSGRLRPAWIGAAGLGVALLIGMFAWSRGKDDPALQVQLAERRKLTVENTRRQQEAGQALLTYAQVDATAGKYRVPVEKAMEALVQDPTLLEPIEIAAPAPGASIADRGATLFKSVHPCATCHSVDGTKMTGPTLKGLFGSPRPLEGGTTVTADEAYVRESIQAPTAKISAGFQPLMPPLPVSEEDLAALVEYIKTLR